MPEMAQAFLDHSPAYQLPLNVPYVGMGSSYFAPLAFKYMGISIQPEMASEFYNYLHAGTKIPLGVLLSQSGKSSEVLWCTQVFEKYIAISNDVQNPLCKGASAVQSIALLAGEEAYSSSKTYINTLLALYKGFGIDVQKAVEVMSMNTGRYDMQGKQMAEKIFELMEQGNVNGLYVTGSGPNIATALQAALILSESTKLNFNGLPMAQYDHGPKETARHSVVINIVAKGKSYDRTLKLGETIRKAGAHVFTVEEPGLTENESIISNIVPFNYLAYYLSELLNVQETFVIGGKVTEVH